MADTTVEALSRTVQTTQIWLNDLTQRGPFQTHQQAYSALRAVLHALRDRLTVEEAVHLSAQLPMLVRGFYFEGWRPAEAPNRGESADAFFRMVERSLNGGALQDAPTTPELTRAVLEFLDDRLDDGQLDHVRSQLPREVAELFPGQRAPSEVGAT